MRILQLGILAAALSAINVQAAVVVTPSSPTSIFTNEGGASAQYQVVLDSPPDSGETVTITPGSVDASEGSVSAALVFTDANWDTPQYITVTGVDDAVADGNVQYTISNAVGSSLGGGAYDGAVASDVEVTNIDDESINIVVSPSTAFGLVEGTSQTITISATIFPAGADITVPISSASGEISLSTASVTLTSAGGYTATFDITAVDDALVDGDIAFTVVTGDPTSTDGSYDALSASDVADISGIAEDNDVAPPPAATSATSLPAINHIGQFILISLIAGFGLHTLRKRK